MAWQPIETAPKGERYQKSDTFIAFSEADGVFVCQAQGGRFYLADCTDRDGDMWESDQPPSHWMPLPPPPGSPDEFVRIPRLQDDGSEI
jgi:hypothetical protein